MVVIKQPAARKGTKGRDSFFFAFPCLFPWTINRAAIVANPEDISRVAIIWDGPEASPMTAASLMSPPPTPQPPGDAIAAIKRTRKPVAAPASEDRRDGGSFVRKLHRNVPVSPAWAAASAMSMQSVWLQSIKGFAAIQVTSVFRKGATRAMGQKSSSALSGTRLVRRSNAAKPAMQAKTNRR